MTGFRPRGCLRCRGGKRPREELWAKVGRYTSSGFLWIEVTLSRGCVCSWIPCWTSSKAASTAGAVDLGAGGSGVVLVVCTPLTTFELEIMKVVHSPLERVKARKTPTSTTKRLPSANTWAHTSIKNAWIFSTRTGCLRHIANAKHSLSTAILQTRVKNPVFRFPHSLSLYL